MNEEKEIVGVTVCPICGAPNQLLKINKNGKLYMMCDHGCNPRYNGALSRQYISRLRAGEAVKTFQNQIIKPFKEVKTNEKTNRYANDNSTAGNGSNAGRIEPDGGNTAFRRTDGANTGISRPADGGIFGRLWNDDDE